mgnify:CR=1 FL=1
MAANQPRHPGIAAALAAIDTSYPALARAGALFGSDQGRSAADLRAAYETRRRAAEGFQVAAKAA